MLTNKREIIILIGASVLDFLELANGFISYEQFAEDYLFANYFWRSLEPLEHIKSWKKKDNSAKLCKIYLFLKIISAKP